jgi:1,2-diacylglycerol 3-alpha-glucosyltransferase
MMRVALFTDTYLPTVDGVVTSVLAIRKGLKEQGHEVMILAPEVENGPVEDGTVYCKARRFKMYPGYRLASFLPREVKCIREFDPDVIHTHGVGGMGIKTIWISKDFDIPNLLTFHTMVMDVLAQYSPLNLNSELLNALLRIYLRNILKRYDTVIVPSRSILSEIEQIAPGMKHVEILPMGVDCERFRPDIDPSGILERPELRERDIILSVGRVSEEKKLDVIIKALPLVKREYPNAALLVVGDGPALAGYKQLVGSMGLESDVVFTGFVGDEELPAYYACCDVFATASKFETQGLVVLEALASGKPVAGANFRAIPDFVVEDSTGHLFEPDDVESCASAIMKCLTARSSMATTARTFAEEHSMESSIKKLVNVYAATMKNKKGSG